MIRLRTIGSAAAGAALLFGSACAELEVTNPNNPDVDRALASPEDVRNVAISGILNWYGTVTNTSPWMALSVTADSYTASFGNFGMRFLNVEPREPYINNSADSDNGGVSLSLWNGTYGDLGIANDALIAMKKGVVIVDQEETDKYKALALFTQAASMSSLALYFDQAFIVDEDTDVENEAPDLQPYADVYAAAMAKWDATIALTATQNETYDAAVLPLADAPLNSARLNQISNTMAARTVAYMARNAAQTGTTDWARVLAYAEKGISKAGSSFDMTVVGDGVNWGSYFGYYGNEPSWVRVDMRLINLMDPTQPAKFTGTIPPKATSADARLESDFEFNNNVIGDPARGIYMQTPYSHKRYRYLARSQPTRFRGPAPYILAAENDLLIAEALIRTNGDLSRAATLINGSRVGRGKLTPVTAADGAAKLMEAIFYERAIELLSTNGVDFLDMRRTDRLQAGTPRHLPVPARELETLGLPIYTFGGVGKPDMDRVGGMPAAMSLGAGRTNPMLQSRH